MSIAIEVALDAVILFLVGFGLFAERKLKLRDGLLFSGLALFCAVSRLHVVSGLPVDARTFSWAANGYAVLPIDNWYSLAFLILATVIAWSWSFGRPAVYTVFATLAAFSLLIVVREAFIGLFYALGAGSQPWAALVSRACSLLALVVIVISGRLRWLRERIAEGSLVVRFMIVNSCGLLVALVALLGFDASRTSDNLGVIAATLTGLALVNLLVGLYLQQRANEKKRIALIEQYIPIIEQLIAQVRARLHEHNNRLLAIAAVAQMATSLEEAQADIAALTRGLPLDPAEQSLLDCDSRIAAGLIIAKMTQAEKAGITVVVEITASPKRANASELEVVEILGILLDNAIEASQVGDRVYLRLERADDALSITVANPHPPLSAQEVIRLFRRHYSTKTAGGDRGHGLANLKAIVERRRGKVLAHNAVIAQRDYLTIGALLP
ncbi:MAG: GHKL domain-containing protein [Propionibacteriaceae bacterium]|nr:GHKL domain-containing protein [Propionibacteriaceae bacterium]